MKGILFFCTLLITFNLYSQTPEDNYRDWLKISGIDQILSLKSVNKQNNTQVLQLGFVEDDLNKQLIGWKSLKIVYPDNELMHLLLTQGISLWRINPNNFMVELDNSNSLLHLKAKVNEGAIRITGDTLDLDKIEIKGSNDSYSIDLNTLKLTLDLDTFLVENWKKKKVLYKRIVNLTAPFFEKFNGTIKSFPVGQDTLLIHVENVRGGCFKSEDWATLCVLQRFLRSWTVWPENDKDCKPYERYSIKAYYDKIKGKLFIEIEGSVASAISSPKSKYQPIMKTGYQYQFKEFVVEFHYHLIECLNECENKCEVKCEK